MKQRPTEEWYARFYRDEFWQKSRLKKRKHPIEHCSHNVSLQWEEDSVKPASSESNGKKDVRVENSIERQKWRASRIYRIIDQVVDLTPNSKVLEIGAGWGEFLALLVKKVGCHGMAVEPSSMTASRIKDIHGFPVVARTIEELAHLKNLNGQFDLITLSHILENTIDPIANLKVLRRLLSPQGKVYIDTCNLYYLNNVNPYHPYIFSPETLKAILGLAGFKIDWTEHMPHPNKVFLISDFKDSFQPMQKALYIAAVISAGPVLHEWVRPKISRMISAQKRGLKILKRGYFLWLVQRKLSTILNVL